MANKYRVLLTLPEMLLEHLIFSKLMRLADFMKDILLIVVDEAHCISHWGPDFRPKYSKLGKLQSYVALNVPVLATSATMTPAVIVDIQAILGFSREKTYLLNLGNNRHNILLLVGCMKETTKDLGALDFLIDEAFVQKPLIQTIVYVNSRDLAHKTWEHFSQMVA